MNVRTKYSEPKRGFAFRIDPENVSQATRNCPLLCVVALSILALSRRTGKKILEVRVFPTRTIIVYEGGVEHGYETPEVLRKALRRFDDTGEWGLPPGWYELIAIPSSQRGKYREQYRRRKAVGDPNLRGRGVYTGSTKPRRVPIRSRQIDLARVRDLIEE